MEGQLTLGVEMLPDRQKLLITELPEGYRVVAIDADSFVVRKPNGEDFLIPQDGHSVGVTVRPTVHPACPESRLGVNAAVSPYTDPMD